MVSNRKHEHRVVRLSPQEAAALWTSSSIRPRAGIQHRKMLETLLCMLVVQERVCPSAVFGPTVYQGISTVQLKKRNTTLGISYGRNLIEIHI